MPNVDRHLSSYKRVIFTRQRHKGVGDLPDKLSNLLKLLIAANLLLLVACGSGGSGPTGTAADDVNNPVSDESSAPNDPAVVVTGNNTSDPITQTPAESDAGTDTDTPQPPTDPIVIDEPGSDNPSEPTEPAEENAADGGNDSTTSEPVTANNGNTVDQPADVANDLAESSPIELFLEEIRLAAGDRVIAINQRFAGGEDIPAEENACLGSFEPGLGMQVTQLDCTEADSGLLIYGSDLILQQVELSDTDSCQLSLSNSVLDNCLVQQASVILPVIWIPVENPALSQIATIRPLPDADIQFNSNNDGILTITNRSNLFPALFCEVNIASGVLLTTDRTRGNCRSQINDLTTRLFEFRQGV